MQPVGQLSHQRLLPQPARPQPGQVATRVGAAIAAPVLAPPPPAPAAAQEGVRVPQQVLRKRDFESELLDRLLNFPPCSPHCRPRQARALPLFDITVCAASLVLLSRQNRSVWTQLGMMFLPPVRCYVFCTNTDCWLHDLQVHYSCCVIDLPITL